MGEIIQWIWKGETKSLLQESKGFEALMAEIGTE